MPFSVITLSFCSFHVINNSMTGLSNTFFDCEVYSIFQVLLHYFLRQPFFISASSWMITRKWNIVSFLYHHIKLILFYQVRQRYKLINVLKCKIMNFLKKQNEIIWSLISISGFKNLSKGVRNELFLKTSKVKTIEK